MAHGILIRIIHNGNSSRLAETKRSLSAFFGDQLRGIPLEVIEKQDAFEGIPRRFAARRLCYVFMTEFKSQHRLRTPRIRYLMVLARFVIDLGLLLGPGWKNMERRIYAEMALSKKHIKALEALSMSERDSLLTVEDDIHFSVESKLDLATVSSTLKRLGKASAFLSLSVAFTTSQLGILKITKKWGDGFMEVEGGIANSTAAYLVTQDFAKQALELLKSTPRLSWLPADWLLTELQSRIPKHVCLDAVAGPFVNGSLFGLDSSEIRP